MSDFLAVNSITQGFIDGDHKTLVLDNVTFEIKDSESVAIMGSSGSGKTTLLHIISGLSKPQHGQVSFEGDVLSQMNEALQTRFRAKKLGFMFQRQYFISELSVIENVALPLRLLGKENALDQAEVLLKILQVPVHSYRQIPNKLSGGEQARVGLARALIHQPKLLVADEPSAALDHGLTDEIFSMIKQLQSMHKFAMVVATHDHSLLKYFDIGYQLRDGILKEINYA